MKRKGRGGEEKTGQPSQVDKLNARQKRRLAKLKEKDEKKKKRQELFHSLTYATPPKPPPCKECG